MSLLITGKSEQPTAGEKLRFGSFNYESIWLIFKEFQLPAERVKHSSEINHAFRFVSFGRTHKT
jgi:hypothetical protein